MLRSSDALAHDAAYLDAIFAAIRAFAHDFEASKRWLARAEQTQGAAWRLSFLREARAAFERATERLAVVGSRLAALGPIDRLPPPLDRIHGNVVTMCADLAAQGSRLEAAEGEVEPIGRA